MAVPQNPSRAESASAKAIDQAASLDRVRCLPSLRAKAAAALADVRAVLADRHGITEADTASYSEDILAGRILDATIRSAQRASLTAAVDPIELLNVVTSAAAERIGVPLVPVEGPTGDNPAHGYVILPRQPETPPWGPTGDAPLLVKLCRYDERATGLGVWHWDVAPYVPGGTIDGRELAGLPPSPDVAAEVGVFAAHALMGAQGLRRI